MENKIFFHIYLLLFLIFGIICKKNINNKCIYISKNSGSEIINFHKFTDKQYTMKIINQTAQDKWSINICNDTIYSSEEDNTTIMKYDSQIVYNNNNNTIRFTGPFLRLENNETMFLKKYNNSSNNYIYKPQSGDGCKDGKYTTFIIFEDYNVEDKKIAEIYELPDQDNCENQLKIHFNLDYAKDYLILQIVLNDGYIFTGIIFFILVVLMFLLCLLIFLIIILHDIYSDLVVLNNLTF